MSIKTCRRMQSIPTAVLGLLFSAVGTAQTANPPAPQPPPAAPVKPVVDRYFGTVVSDPYRYMEKMDDPAVQSWIKTQNEYTRLMLARIPGRQRTAPRGLTLIERIVVMMIMIALAGLLVHMLPSMLSQFVSTIKDTSLGYIINVPELTFAANQLSNRLLTKPFEVFLILALIYYGVCVSLTQLAGWLERVIATRRAGQPALVEPVLMEAGT